MPVDVQFAVAQDQLPLPEDAMAESITGWAEAVMSQVEDDHGQEGAVCVRLVEEEESRSLNARYRGKDKPTNVLSFPADLPPLPLEEEVLGDIVICVGVVANEARQQGKPMLDHLAHMVVHGMLHLYGYDHERDRQSMHEMESLEREILERFEVSDPYRER